MTKCFFKYPLSMGNKLSVRKLSDLAQNGLKLATGLISKPAAVRTPFYGLNSAAKPWIFKKILPTFLTTYTNPVMGITKDSTESRYLKILP